jgi:SAM-dependent methyltransferase
VSSDSREYLRSTFEEVPELYDSARPVYPATLFDDLAVLADIPDTARILEIGCGTGQATLALAERGYRVTCVELGAQLAAIARHKLSVFTEVEVINADFETWQAPQEEFDAVVAFTSFHWLDPARRFARVASLLREGGALAVVETEHVLPLDGDAIFVEMQEDYDAVLPDVQADGPRHPDAVGDLCDEIEASGFFLNALSRRYLWDVIYTADAFAAVLETYSPHRALDGATRKRLHDRLRSRIEARPEGTVRKTYLATLNLARSRRAASG